ncbi:Fer-1-like protein 5 [Aix galericulata]|nr:Fer-1-like protein 5 [Aix galericulata]
MGTGMDTGLGQDRNRMGKQKWDMEMEMGWGQGQGWRQRGRGSDEEGDGIGDKDRDKEKDGDGTMTRAGGERMPGGDRSHAGPRRCWRGGCGGCAAAPPCPLEVQCGGQVLRTPPIADLAANPNFPINAFLLPLVRARGQGGGGGCSPPGGAAGGTGGDGEVCPQHLPAEEEYVPPLRLRVLDTQGFGYRPELGQACVRGLGRFCCQPHGGGQPHGPGAPLASLGPGTALPAPAPPCLSLVAPSPSLPLPGTGSLR